MTSEPIRDPRGDHLLTPQNCALVIIDYQPTHITSIRSMDQDVLVDQVVHLARFGMLYRLPIVLSTVNVNTGRNQPTIAPLQDVLPGITALDRTTINAWEDAEFKQAVRAAGRCKLIMAALWTDGPTRTGGRRHRAAPAARPAVTGCPARRRVDRACRGHAATGLRPPDRGGRCRAGGGRGLLGAGPVDAWPRVVEFLLRLGRR